MTVNIANTGDGATNGSNVTNASSGGSSGVAFDNAQTNIGAGATVAFDSTHVLGGHPLAVKLATGVTSTSAYFGWGASFTASSVPQMWFRFYLYFTAAPSGNTRVFQALSSGSLCAGVLLNTTGALRFVDKNSSIIFTTTVTLTPNTWSRIEGFVIGDPSVGQVELRVYKTYDAAPQNYNEIDTSAASQNTNAAAGQARFGTGANVASFGPIWYASPGLSDTAYLGPEAPVSGVPRVLPGPALLNGPMRYARPRLITPVQPSGQRVIPVTLPATVTTTGTIQDQASKTLTASVTTTGTLSRGLTKTLTVTVTTTATVARQIARAFAASVTTTASLIRSPGKTLTAAVATAGSLARQAGKTLTAGVTTTATLARNPGKTFAAAITTTAALVRSPGKAFPVSVTTTASLGAKALAKTLSVTVTTAGSLARALSRAFPVVTVTTTAAYAKGYFRTFATSVTTTGAIGRGIGKILSAVVSTLGSIVTGHIPGPRQPGVLTITPYGPLTAVLTLGPAGAQAAVVTIAPYGAQAAVLTVSTPGQQSVTWEPAPPLPAQPSPAVVLTSSA